MARRPLIQVRTNRSVCWRSSPVGSITAEIPVFVGALLVLIVAGIPFLRLNLTSGDERLLPDGTPARTTMEQVKHDFPAGEADAIIFHSRREDRELSTPAWLQNEANTMNGPAVEPFISGRV